MFLRNAWYVAGWSGDYGRELVAQTLLAQCVVLYRKRDGTPVALEDACPHRKLPLSKGNLKDDVIECGYHGLTFDGSGKCVAAPTQPGQIPEGAVVRSYPVVDRYRLLWIWMGDPDRANPDDILHIENFDNPTGAVLKAGPSKWNATTCGSATIFSIQVMLPGCMFLHLQVRALITGNWISTGPKPG